jgi:(p)ppGpp synthase/HD superfamily hydrolase
MNLIEAAIELAVEAHRNQRDKAGQPYILHPLRLMLQMETDVEMIAAVLHDVVEDSTVAFDDLRARGLPEEAIEAVVCLTKQNGEDYDQFVQRVASNPIARKVKIADLEDNMNLARIPRLRPEDLKRLEKYHRALHRLKGI